VAFTVIPAIDLWRGRLASFTPEGPRPVEAFGGDPAAAADAFASAGARWIHVVDLDLAFDGEPANVDVVRDLATRLPDVRIQVAGGIRRAAEASRFFDAGADRVVMGSGALVDEAEVTGAIGRWGVALWVGIEVVDGRIRSRGRDPVELDLMSTMGWVAASGVAGVVVTAVDRVNTAAGSDTPTVRRVVRAGRPVVAAGGVTTAKDVLAVREAGAIGAIVGRAALEGGMGLLREPAGEDAASPP
jgi:phosphoribosylformimino-5-aminoimidazole carboxamide ribonucleotide (ProFAR) isomerase